MDRFEDAKLRIKEATDVVALIESYLPLKPRGRTLVALCPFHAENSPSFTVFRDSQHFRCFGCGKTGDAFTWLMERDGLSFRESMEVLADRSGISLEGVWKGRKPDAQKGPDPYQALAEVAAFFHRELDSEDGSLARDYLAGRGLAPAVDGWRLGFHPRSGGLQRFVQQKNLPRDVLEAAGLLRNGREPFAGRVIFPIDDERGRTVGFGGRLVPGSPGSEGDGDYKPPKYLNSPESPFFNKRRVLFGLHKAKQAGQRRIIVMEGYTDVIACHLAGFAGAVASLGTAFTQDHAKMVERYATEGIVLMFDGDRAGVQAAERAFRELVNSRLPVRIALMSDAQGATQDSVALGSVALAKDPADVVTARPGEDPELVVERRARFADVIDGAEDSLAVWFRLLRRRLDFSQSVHLETAARECATILALVAEPVRRAARLQEMARHLAVPPPTLERLLQKLQKPRVPARSSAESGSAEPGPAGAGAVPQRDAAAPKRSLTLAERTEVELLACVLARPLLLVDLDFSADDPLEVAAVATLLGMASDGVALGRTATADLLRYLFARAAEAPELQNLLGVAAERAGKVVEPDVVLAGLVEGRRRLCNEPRKRALRQQLQQAMAIGDRDHACALQQQLLAAHRQDRPRNQQNPKVDSPRPATSGWVPGGGDPRSVAENADGRESLPADRSGGSPDRGPALDGHVSAPSPGRRMGTDPPM